MMHAQMGGVAANPPIKKQDRYRGPPGVTDGFLLNGKATSRYSLVSQW